jgi:hypothetical protein
MWTSREQASGQSSGHAVRTENQIGLSLFHEVFSRAVDPPVLGRRMMVYEEHYVTAYDGDVPYSDRGLRRLARDMEESSERIFELMKRYVGEADDWLPN